MKRLLFLLPLFVWQCAGGQIITTVAGNDNNTYTGDGGPATAASLYNPLGVAADAAGNIYIADTKHHCIRKVTASGIITTITGNGTAGFSGDGGPAVDAQIYIPSKVAVDGSGSIYFVDNGNFRLRKIDLTGTITTIAGDGTPDNTGDGGPAVGARINACAGLAIDNAGNIYLGDNYKNIIRKINTAGIISTVAGSGSTGYDGDGGPATLAKMNDPFGIDVDNAGNLYIAEYGNNCIRKVNPSGIISTIAGTVVSGYSGDNGPATSAKLDKPGDVVADNFGNLFIADHNNHAIRKVKPNGVISSIAGNGVSGYSGDGGLAIAAQLSGPGDISIDLIGNLYIADYTNNRIRKVTNVVGVVNKNFANVQEAKIYPNPSTGNCTLYLPCSSDETISIVITDITGRQVQALTGATNSPVNIRMDVPSGVYIANIIMNDQRTSVKLEILK